MRKLLFSVLLIAVVLSSGCTQQQSFQPSVSQNLPCKDGIIVDGRVDCGVRVPVDYLGAVEMRKGIKENNVPTFLEVKDKVEDMLSKHLGQRVTLTKTGEGGKLYQVAEWGVSVLGGKITSYNASLANQGYEGGYAANQMYEVCDGEKLEYFAGPSAGDPNKLHLQIGKSCYSRYNLSLNLIGDPMTIDKIDFDIVDELKEICPNPLIEVK